MSKKTNMQSRTPAGDVELVPFDKFSKAAKLILSNTKKQSDAQLADFQASNRKRREAKKKG